MATIRSVGGRLCPLSDTSLKVGEGQMLAIARGLRSDPKLLLLEIILLH